MRLDRRVFPAGYEAQSQGMAAVSHELVRAVREAGVALKTKLLPSPGGSSPLGPPAKANVLFRRARGVFAVVRPIQNLPGLPTRFRDVNFTLVREVTEDLDATTEHEVVPGVVQSFKIVTEAAPHEDRAVRRAALASCAATGRWSSSRGAAGLTRRRCPGGLPWARLDRVRVVGHIPVDRRHESKVYYPDMYRMLK